MTHVDKDQTRIRDLFIREVLDSQGHFSLEAEVLLEDGTRAHESAPRGITTGKYDADLISFPEASAQLPRLRRELIGQEAAKQHTVDGIIGACLGSSGGRLRGANLGTALSMAICRAAAISTPVPLYRHISHVFNQTPRLPRLLVNVLNGGPHAENGLPFTEFMLVTGEGDAATAVKNASAIYRQLYRIIKEKYGPAGVLVGAEGGFAPRMNDPQEAVDLLDLAIRDSEAEDTAAIGIDMAAGSLYDTRRKNFRLGEGYLTPKELISYYVEFADKNPKLVYFEDPLTEDQLSLWAQLHRRLGDRIIAGDDLISTSPSRLEAAAAGAVNGVVLKINQCGTLSELGTCFLLARSLSLTTVMSQRSCETDSDFLTHLAVGLGADFLKAGACARERIVKYNALTRIAEHFNGSQRGPRP